MSEGNAVTLLVRRPSTLQWSDVSYAAGFKDAESRRRRTHSLAKGKHYRRKYAGEGLRLLIYHLLLHLRPPWWSRNADRTLEADCSVVLAGLQTLKEVKGILNKLTPEKFDTLSAQLIQLVTNEEVLQSTITLIFENAVAQPTFVVVYADLCDRLSKVTALPGSKRTICCINTALYNQKE